MDKVFDDFFQDVFNSNRKNASNILPNNDKFVKTPIFDNSNLKHSLKINVNPDVNLPEFEFAPTFNPNPNMLPNIIKNRNDDLSAFDLKLKTRLNEIDKNVHAKPNTLQNELLIEKQKWIDNSVRDKKIDNVNKNLDNKPNDEYKLSDNNFNNNLIVNSQNTTEIKSSDNSSQSSDSLINKLNMKESFTNIFKGTSSAAFVKYSFYLTILIIMIIIGLFLIKFCLAAKDSDKPIKTRHSINEIEDELNNMRGREKLF